MRRYIGRRRLVFLGALAAAAAAAVGGYAYFTTTASGTGTADVGSNTTLTITQTNTISGLIPGGSAVPIEYSIVNTAGNGAQNLGLVSASITSVTGGSNTPNVCSASDFTITAATSSVGTIADGGTFDSTTDATTEPKIAMKETGANQDGCQGATVNLSLDGAQGS